MDDLLTLISILINFGYNKKKCTPGFLVRKMLTGEELCTSGEATLGGFDIKTQQNQARPVTFGGSLLC